MIPTTTQTYTLNFHHVDSRNQLRLVTLFKMMQETAWMHTNDNGMGLDLLNQKQFWALSQILVKMNEYPGWGETIHIKTWVRASNGLFVERDFSVFDSENRVIAVCSSIWVLVDLEKRRPMRLRELMEQMPFVEEYSIDEPIPKLANVENGELLETFKIRSSDIDMNQHVNNVQYVKWVIDCMPISVLETKQLRSLNIQFQSECSRGEEVAVKAAFEPAGAGMQGFRKRDQKPVFRSFISWY